MVLTTVLFGGQHGRGAGRDRHLVADLQGRGLVVEHDQRGIGQHLDVGDAVQRVEDEARLGFRRRAGN